VPSNFAARSIAAAVAAGALIASGCGTSTGGGGPHVVAFFPADGATSVAATTQLKVTFDMPIAVVSMTADTAGSAGCGGSFQLSSDDFASCIRLTSSPIPTADGRGFSGVPSTPLLDGTTYRMRVKASVSSATGRVLGSDLTTTTGFTVATPAPSPTPAPGSVYSHTVVIDGTNDFVQSNEGFQTSSSGAGYTTYVAWDASNLYLAMTGSDIGSGSTTKWFQAYVGGSAGTMTGQTYNTQTPALPFPAKWHVRWKASNDFTDAQVWTGSAWTEANWNFNGRVFKNGTFLEMSIRRSDIGSPAHVPIVVDMVNETANLESTYAGTPHDTFVLHDGYDRDFSKWYDFDFSATLPPNQTVEH
jgi:hypothetical protein